jgi:protein gp37
MPGWDGAASANNNRAGFPFRFKKPTRFFVNSMGDLFHSSVPFEWLEQVWNVMGDCPEHTFMTLTKRPKRMLEWFDTGRVPTLGNLWVGITAENQKAWDDRMTFLAETPGAVKFVSFEPLLEAIDMHGGWLPNWAIVGAETGPHKRPCRPEWIDSLRSQCAAAGVRFFGKVGQDGKPIYPREMPL